MRYTPERVEFGSRDGISRNRLSILVYAGAMTVSEKHSRSKGWLKNSTIEVESLHRLIGKATAELNRRRENAEVAPTPGRSPVLDYHL